jgi:hypothetical protein
MRAMAGSLSATLLLTTLLIMVASSEETRPPTITLDRAVHFTAADGGYIQVPAATYRIEQAGESGLRLAKEGAQPIEIQATTIPHEESVSAPLAVAVVEEGQDDTLHLVLVVPGGQALDALGSFSGTRSRATFSPALSPFQLQSAVSQVRVIPQQSAAASSITPVRVPQAQPGAGVKPHLKAGDTGFVSVPTHFVGPITWGYLRMNAPEVVVGTLQQVQAGRMNPDILQGLAAPDSLKSLLATKFDLQQLSAKAAVTAPPPSSAVARTLTQSKIDWAAVVNQSQARNSPLRPGAVTPTLRVNDFTPQQLALGSIWDGQTARGVVRIASLFEGLVTASLPPNTPFRIVGVAAATGLLQRNSAMLSAVTATPQQVTVTATNPFSAYARAGQEVLVTVEFAPHFDLFSQTAGNYRTTLSVSGQNWFASVPVSGLFNGIKLGVIPALDAYQLDVINPLDPTGTQCAVPIPQGVKLINVDQQSHTVLIEPAAFPGQFSMSPVTVTIPPGATQHVQLAITLHCLIARDSREFQLNLKITYEGQQRSTSFTLVIYPYMYMWQADGTLGGCQYASTFTAYPDGQFHLNVSASSSTIERQEFDYMFFLLGNPVAELVLSLNSAFGKGTQQGYGFRQPGLAEHYTNLFDQPNADVRLRCTSKGLQSP